MHRDPRYNNLVFRQIALTCALGLAACGPRAAMAPAADGLQAYLTALRSDDPKPLYDMLTSEQRTTIPYETWVATWKSHAAERAHQADLVEDRWQGHIFAHASVTYGDGQTVNLQQEDAGWRLEQAVVATSSAPTPQAGIAQLVTALERQDLPALFALMSADRRESIEQRLHTFLEGLVQQDLDGHSNLHKVSESRYELIWSHENVRYRLVFVLEHANWRLDEVHLGPDPAAAPPAEESLSGTSDEGPLLRKR